MGQISNLKLTPHIVRQNILDILQERVVEKSVEEDVGVTSDELVKGGKRAKPGEIRRWQDGKNYMKIEGVPPNDWVEVNKLTPEQKKKYNYQEGKKTEQHPLDQMRESQENIDNQKIKLEKLVSFGVTDVKELMRVTNLDYAYVYEALQKSSSQGVELNPGADDLLKQGVEEKTVKLPEITVDDRWGAYGDLLDVIISGDTNSKGFLAYGSGGVGKAQPLYSKVLTPNGFIEMGDIVVGQEVVCPDGSISKVLNIYPQEGLRKVYELTFIDETKVRCDEEHLWKVKERVGYNWKVVSLNYIIERGVRLPNGLEWRFGIPFSNPIPYEKKDLKVHPYLLGYILGDGGITQDGTISLSFGDRDREFILSKLSDLLEGEEIVFRSQIDYHIVSKQRYEKLPLKQYLKEVGLQGKKSDEKFIPKEYLQGSIYQRLELIQGLMDSDGYVDNKGTCIFAVTSKQLAYDFYELVSSFGHFSKIVENNYNVKKGVGKLVYEVTFSMPKSFIPVTIPFKVKRYLLKKNYQQALSIVDIQYIGEEKTQCISIDHPDHLYITDNYRVTHNTYTMMMAMNNHVINSEGDIRKLTLEEIEMRKADPEGFEASLVNERPLRKFNPEVDTDPADYDWVKVTGRTTAAGLYLKLYEHNGKLIVFDDCDSVFDDDAAINTLKGAIDTSGDGQIDWSSSTRLKIGVGEDAIPVPNSFKFTGRIIFISNIPYHKFMSDKLQPIAGSRCTQVDLTMTMDQTIEKLEQIKDHIVFTNSKGNVINVTQEQRDDAMQFIKDHKDVLDISLVNGRTLGNLIMIRSKSGQGTSGMDWTKTARVVLNLYDRAPLPGSPEARAMAKNK